MSYVIKIEKFEGPLDLLLQLIEQEELSITEVSLAKVTETYLQTIRNAGLNPEDLADFLVIAAKLILIKSRILLPEIAVEQEEGISLEAQLKLYREFVEASKKIEDMIKQKRFMFGREKIVLEKIAEFSPPPKLKVIDLKISFQRVLCSLEPLIKLPKAAIRRVVSIQEKINHIRSLILDRVMFKFGEVLKGAKNKTEAIISFLALLELVKQRTIEVKQDALFEEIIVHKTTN